MDTQLVEIQPRELKFIFESKKQSSCSVQVANNTQYYVAFKVKTTTPKKYCVRPNVGVIRPKSAGEFTVTMQAQEVAPPDMVCKDKFLIQSIVVLDDTNDEDIEPGMFSKDDGKYVQENKLRVVLISPPNSPVLSPLNGALNQGLVHEASILKEPVLSRVEILTPPHMVAKSVEESKMLNGEGLKPAKLEELNPTKNAELKPKENVIDREELETRTDAEVKPMKSNVEELKPAIGAELNQRNDVIDRDELKPEKNTELNPSKEAVNSEELQLRKGTELKLMKDVEFETVKATEKLKLVNDIEEMKVNLNKLTTKLSEAEVTISKLKEERRLSIKEGQNLQGELEMLRSKAMVKNVQVGYPLMFVSMVAFISFMVGCRILPFLD